MLRIGLMSIAVLSAAYALRWPLLRGAIVGKIRQKALAVLNADVDLGRLEGSLISSVRARDVDLHPRPGSPLHAARVERVDVNYGFFGISGIQIRVRGLRAELEHSTKPPAPPHRAIRDTLSSLETTKLPARIELENSVVVLADGTPLEIDQASLRGDEFMGRLRTRAVGQVAVEGGRGPNHRLRLHATASQGPVSDILLDLKPARGADHELRVTATAGREKIEWKGSVRFGGERKPDLVQGELTVRDGRASTRIDLQSGATDVEWDARGIFDKEIAAEVLSRGRVRGSLADPLERWTVSGGFVKIPSAVLKHCSFTGEITFSEGTLAKLPWQGWLTCGRDRAEAKGTISWTKFLGLEAQVSLDANDLSSYRGFLPESLSANAREIHLEGRAALGQAGPLFEGSFRIGRGEVQGIAWDTVRWAGRVTPDEAVTCDLVVQGMARAPFVSLLGSVRRNPGGLDFQLAAPRIALAPPAGIVTDLVLEGRVDDRGVDVTKLDGRLDYGPFRAIGRWDFRTEEKAARLHLVGVNALVFSDKLGRVRASPDLWVSGSATRGWRVEGTVELPSMIFYGELGDPQASRGGRVKEAAAPKLRLDPAEGGGFVLPGGIADGDKVALDLTLRIAREARVENSALGAMLEADLHLGGTLAAPAISGAVHAHRGEVKLATGVFIRIERADITLPREAGHRGSIYFKGRSGKGQGAITVVISGPLDDPVLTLSSDPPRKQEELLAALAFGKGPGTLSGQDVVGTLAVKAFEQATDTWPKAEPGESFWSRLSLSAASEEAVDPQKRVPWQLPPTASARGTIVRTEYLLNSFLSVVAESNQEANVSGDLKVRFHFR